MRRGEPGSIWIEWQHIPPAPGCQRSRVACSVRPGTDSHDAPESAERRSAPGAAPRKSVLGSDEWPGSTCQTSPSSRSGSSIFSDRSHVVPPLPERWTVPP